VKKFYERYISEVESIDGCSERLTYLTCVLRSLLQVSVVSTFEIASKKAPSDEMGLSELTNRFCKPTDGLPIQILDVLIPKIRGYVDKKYLWGWFESLGDNEVPLSKQILEWVEFRNKRPGHGVLDDDLIREWSAKTENLVLMCLKVFEDVIPDFNGEGLQLSARHGNLTIDSPIFVNGSAIVILEVVARKGIWKLKGQILSRENAEDFTVNLPEDNVFSSVGIRDFNEYDLAEVVSNNKDYSFFHNIPVRQTDTFEGRDDELDLLKEWMDDEDSRYCLVYGDGGYGKTTLVLEMLNKFLESEYDFEEPLPTIISYHSAKMTRWTEDGLIHLTGISPVMDECVRDLVRCFYPVLSKDWYSVSGRSLVDKAVGVLRENKLTRDDVLLVIDNTETLATSSQEVRDLGSFFKSLGKSIGRLIVTSRRREFIEATPIVVEGLSEKDCISLMERLAVDFKAKPIIQAGEPTLRKVCKQLMYKPILLEALVKYISRANVGIDAAMDSVFKRSNEELLEFLYEDAWARMNQLQKEVFLTLIHLSSPLDNNTIGKTCQEIGLQHGEFQAALEETHFSIVSDYGRSYTIELVDLAGKFFYQQFGRMGVDNRERLKKVADRVDKYAAERERVEREYKADRVAEAFRSEYAKAAKVSADKGEIENAIGLYELALEDDPLNSALHDRFSWFLLNKANRYQYAREVSKKAVELEPDNCDAVVGLALVHYRIGDIEEGDRAIEHAGQVGRPLSFCLLRKAIARYYKSKEVSGFDLRLELLDKSLEFLDKAGRSNNNSGGYDAKNLKDIKRYQGLVKRAKTSLRSQITKSRMGGF